MPYYQFIKVEKRDYPSGEDLDVSIKFGFWKPDDAQAWKRLEKFLAKHPEYNTPGGETEKNSDREENKAKITLDPETEFMYRFNSEEKDEGIVPFRLSQKVRIYPEDELPHNEYQDKEYPGDELSDDE